MLICTFGEKVSTAPPALLADRSTAVPITC
jgi:hypothetical protein